MQTLIDALHLTPALVALVAVSSFVAFAMGITLGERRGRASVDLNAAFRERIQRGPVQVAVKPEVKRAEVTLGDGTMIEGEYDPARGVRYLKDLSLGEPPEGPSPADVINSVAKGEIGE